jgi:hypothetical protein
VLVHTNYILPSVPEIRHYASHSMLRVEKYIVLNSLNSEITGLSYRYPFQLFDLAASCPSQIGSHCGLSLTGARPSDLHFQPVLSNQNGRIALTRWSLEFP